MHHRKSKEHAEELQKLFILISKLFLKKDDDIPDYVQKESRRKLSVVSLWKTINGTVQEILSHLASKCCSSKQIMEGNQ